MRTDETTTAGRLIVVAGAFSFGPSLHTHHSQVIESLRGKGVHIEIIPFNEEAMLDVAVYGAHIAQTVPRILGSYQRTKADMLGVSMGGDAALHAMCFLGLEPMIASYTALATPFYGCTARALHHLTRLARKKQEECHLFTDQASPFDLRTLWSQLAAESPFLENLRTRAKKLKVRITSIAGTFDTICPSETAWLEHTTQVELPFRHHEVVSDSVLYAQVLDYCR